MEVFALLTDSVLLAVHAQIEREGMFTIEALSDWTTRLAINILLCSCSSRILHFA